MNKPADDPPRVWYATILLAVELAALTGLQLGYGFLWSYGHQTTAMLLELATAATAILFAVLVAVFLSTRRWSLALAALPLPCLVAAFFWIDRFDLVPQSIAFADDVRFALSANRYSKDVAAIPARPNERRLVTWPWREFEFAPTQPWFVQLVYDESDEVARGQDERSTAWRERMAAKDSRFSSCAQDVRRLRDHFYLVTLTC
jgi:hypothetical protein